MYWSGIPKYWYISIVVITSEKSVLRNQNIVSKNIWEHVFHRRKEDALTATCLFWC